MKAVLRGNFIPVKAHVENEDGSEFSKLTLHHKELGETNKPKTKATIRNEK